MRRTGNACSLPTIGTVACATVKGVGAGRDAPPAGSAQPAMALAATAAEPASRPRRELDMVFVSWIFDERR
ncbi:hypothetical protein GmRootV116_34370 [Variovorax sp. V116]